MAIQRKFWMCCKNTRCRRLSFWWAIICSDLITQRRSEIIKAHEEEIITKAMSEGHAKLYGEGENISTYKSNPQPASQEEINTTDSATTTNNAATAKDKTAEPNNE